MKPQKFKLGNLTCSTHSIKQFIDELEFLLADKSLSPRMLLCVNAHIFNLAYKDSTLRSILNNARIVMADGMSIVWAARLFGEKMQERCNVTEAFRAFLLAEGLPQNNGILIGCSEDEARRAAKQIEATSGHCRIIETFSGFLNDSEYKKIFKKHRNVDFILLGMGTPKTEEISIIAAEICPDAIVWGIGGGTIKIFAGTLMEAPVFWRRSGLQWLYRLFRQPISLFSRYLIGNPLFIYRILRESIKKNLKLTSTKECNEE